MKPFFYSILGMVVVCCALAFETTTAHAQFSYVPALYNGREGLCRLGINKVHEPLASYPINPMRLGWFVDYTAVSPNAPGVAYFPVIRLEQTGGGGYNYSYHPSRTPATAAQLAAHVVSKPGLHWLIGNEPDRIQFQDDIEPHIYATAYHELYHIIKEADPTAKVIAGTIVQPTPVRLEYLDLVLESYYNSYKEAMPVDGWAFHNFILNEASCSYYQSIGTPPAQLAQICWGADIPPGVSATDGLRITIQENDSTTLFREQVYRFRQWMAERGYRDTPAYLSEFGVLMPEARFPEFNAERVSNFMNWTFNFLLTESDPNIGYPGDNNRLVQRFAWYSLDDDINHNGFLFDRDLPVESNLTPIGDNFINFANTVPETVDFYLDEINMIGAPLLASQGTTTITLEARIGNSGSLAANTPTTVRFYVGDPNSGGVQIGSAQSVSLPGCGEQTVVSMEWGGITPGDYTIFAEVQAAGGDLDPSNNQGTLAVSFFNENLFIPTMKHDFLIPE